MDEDLDVWTVMRTARAVRRYTDEPVDPAVVTKCLQAATWAPSGGNQQPWHFVILRSPELRKIIGEGGRLSWETMTGFYDIDVPPESDRSTKARTLRTMHHHMTTGADVPVCILFCIQPQRGPTDLEQGASIFPAMQNFLLAARAQGLGAAVVLWHRMVEDELRTALGVPDDWQIAATVTAGWPAGHHGPVTRRPAVEVMSVDTW
jgi:nitroreductase